jgi:hypothetical protein
MKRGDGLIQEMGIRPTGDLFLPVTEILKFDMPIEKGNEMMQMPHDTLLVLLH